MTNNSQFCTVAQDRPSGGPYKLCYELAGSGPNKVLLVMGLSGTLRAWDSTVKQLVARGGFEICTFDNRDAGESDKPGPGYTVKDMAMDAYELLQHLGWKNNVFLAGVSMGGMISQELVLLAPKDTFAAVVFISTHAGMTIPPALALWTFFQILFVPGERTELQQMESFARLLYPTTWLAAKAPEGSGFATNRDMIYENLRGMTKAKGVQSELSRKGQLGAIHKHYVSKSRLNTIGKLGIPTLVMVGTEDSIIRPSNSHHLAKHIGCPLEVFKGAGHVLATEQPERFHNLLVQTFAKSPAFVDEGPKPNAEELKKDAELSPPAPSL
ncbi:Alpha/Beta hydrolase protein [Fimicolochytrium jonesii]|uniref:Alpha/Beta hydrolase protein n=1 Tax=Fimicolochytrium jonesii TaxID=1396493 RepID=UPI0022FE35D8|nr:Alpha/Beta hydrolase protein [Fimicolochytrium jonesii]KAI8824243.1 Alpha/Beta hydrolase protein [Fimicolochytrium jonesii]